MRADSILCTLLLAGVSAFGAAPAKNTASDILTTDRERDTFAIAEQLYRQGHVAGLDAAAKKNILSRLCVLLEKFVKDFPKSVNKNKALYMQAVCADEIGESAQALKAYRRLCKEAVAGKQDDYVAEAAYYLANHSFALGLNEVKGHNAMKEAIKYYALVEKQSRHTDRVYIARYRMARAHTHIALRSEGQTSAKAYENALKLYETHFSATSQQVPENIADAAHYSYAQLLTTLGGDDNLTKAVEQYKSYLKGKSTDQNQRSIATLQIARISTKLGKLKDAAEYYGKMNEFGEIEYYDDDAKMEVIRVLYQAQKHDEILKAFPGGVKDISFLNQSFGYSEQRARCAYILGLVHVSLSHYAQGAEFFVSAENFARGTRLGAEAGYNLITCLQSLKNGVEDKGTAVDILPDLSAYGVTYLSTYGQGELKDLRCVNCARLIFADQLLRAKQDSAWEHYRDVDPENLPESRVEDAAYKRAWFLYKAWSDQKTTESPLPALDYYIKEVTGHKHLSDMQGIRGNYYLEMASRKSAAAKAAGISADQKAKLEQEAADCYAAAIPDYDVVILNHKGTKAYLACLQRAVYACMNLGATHAAEAKRYLGELLNYASQQNDKANPVPAELRVSDYAIAEANFNLGCLCFNDETEKAIEYFNKAMQEDAFAESATVCLVQCYYKLKSTHKLELLTLLADLKNDYYDKYKQLSPGILHWCGWAWYQEASHYELSDDPQTELSPEQRHQQYLFAVEYLNDSVDKNKTEEYTDAAGKKQKRPVATPSLWLILARACLEVGLYTDTATQLGGISAIDYYLSQETDPHRRADAMKLKAMMFNGCGKYQEASELCSAALNLGISGPVLASIRLVAGDAAYLQGDFAKAAQLYSLVANFDRTPDLSREAFYKAACAHRRNGNEQEALHYEERLNAQLSELKIDPSTPLKGLPVSVGRHVTGTQPAQP